MKILLNDDTYINVYPLKAKQNILINYTLVDKSDRKQISIDRGLTTDRYECELEFLGEETSINTLYNELKLLRDNRKDVQLTEIDYYLFGDHINYSIPINTVVTKIKDLSSPSFHLKTFSVTLLCTNTLSFTGSISLPELTCLDAGWMGYNEWNTQVNETYTRNNYFVDSVADLYVFTGKYTLSVEDNRDLHMFWQSKRGKEFQIADGVFGITGMFGPNVDTQYHYVVIKEIKYETISPEFRSVTITLIRNGGE
jgi:hypothetical protein